MTLFNRREFLKRASISAAAVAFTPSFSSAAANSRVRLTPAAEIEARIRAARPLLGGKIPADLADRLGTTHYDGHYFLTKKPYLVEGAEEIHKLGMNVAKFWLREDKLPGYSYNSDWQIPLDARLVDVLQHKYFDETLALPFRTVLFEVFPLSQKPGSYLDYESDFSDEKKQFQEVAAFLLKKYSDRDVTFILQHWEGDWMLRGKEGKTWTALPADELKRRCDGFARFLTARQQGVEQARLDNPGSRAKVFHAAEVNKVWEGTQGIPTLMTHVLPHVTLDLVSWSAYDGLSSPVSLWQGIELLRHYMRPSPTFGTNAVYIGEVGKPENLGVTGKELTEFWDWFMGTTIALGLPWIVHWELYCNEPKDGTKSDRRPRKEEELRGFWLVKPDGSLSHAGKYLTTLLQNAGGRLPREQWLQALPK